MAEHVAVLPCECGGIARQVFGDVQVFVKCNQRPFKLDATCVPIGWERGNTDPQKQQARYERRINGYKKLAQQNDKQAIKGGIRHIGSVPRELVRMRRNQYGPDYLDPSVNSPTEIKEQLKSDGLYFHKD